MVLLDRPIAPSFGVKLSEMLFSGAFNYNMNMDHFEGFNNNLFIILKVKYENCVSRK